MFLWTSYRYLGFMGLRRMLGLDDWLISIGYSRVFWYIFVPVVMLLYGYRLLYWSSSGLVCRCVGKGRKALVPSLVLLLLAVSDPSTSFNLEPSGSL